MNDLRRIFFGHSFLASGSKLAGACVVGLALSTNAASEEVLRASPFGPPDHLLNTKVLVGWANAVEGATEGRVRVEVRDKPVAPPSQVLEALRSMQADVSIVSNGAAGTNLPLNALVEFAAQTPDAERASVAYQRVADRHPALTNELIGVEVIAVFTHGPGALLLAQRDASAVDGTAGRTLHAGGAGAADAVRALGATALVAPGPAAKTLLAERRVDGTVTALETLDGFGLAPQIEAIVLMPGGFYCAGFSLVMNRSRWSALSAADRAAIRSVSGESLARLAGRAWDAADRDALAAARKRGTPVMAASAAVVSRIRAASATREAQWIADMGTGESEARQALAEYRDEMNAR